MQLDGTAPLTRRERLRLATVDEIKQVARAQMAKEGTSALSLRAVARDMGMTASAIYRYFDSHDDLVTALCVDAYQDLASQLETVGERPGPYPQLRRLVALAGCARAWSLRQPADFALIFGTPLPGYEAPPEATLPAGMRCSAVLCGVVQQALAAGELDRAVAPLAYADRNPPDGQGLAALGLTAEAVSLALGGWVVLLGFLTHEVFGHTAAFAADPEPMFRAHVQAMLVSMGADHDAARTATVAERDARAEADDAGATRDHVSAGR